MLTREEVQEFKRITLETMGLKLNDEQAMDQGTRLIVLFELMLKHEKLITNDLVATDFLKEENKQ